MESYQLDILTNIEINNLDTSDREVWSIFRLYNDFCFLIPVQTHKFLRDGIYSQIRVYVCKGTIIFIVDTFGGYLKSFLKIEFSMNSLMFINNSMMIMTILSV